MSNLKEKSSVTPKNILRVVIPIILTIAVAVGIAIGINAITKKNNLPKEPEYTVKVDEATGKEKYYDKNGNFVYAVSKEYADTEKKLVTREIYSDEKNNVTKSILYKDDGKTVDRVDEYSNGQISKQHLYENGKETGEYITYERDDKGNEVASIVYNKDNSIKSKKEQKYNSDNNITLYLETDGNGKTLSKTEYFYDSKGVATKTVFYDADGITGYVEYEYNAAGQRVRMNQYADGKLIDFRTFEYDKDGNVVKDIYHEAKEAK